jgi:hypothetical protein
MKIAGKQTDGKWILLKQRLQSKPTRRLWASAFSGFYRKRIDTRYLDPIASIKRHDRELGEGFAIVALFCTLIEYLESCERGRNFRLVGRSNTTLGDYEYSERDAAGYFKDFLRTRVPFNALVPGDLVESFYRDVRCGLLHEARTKGGWSISAKPSRGLLVLQRGTEITLFRNELSSALELYIADYRQRLMSDLNTQAAFIRKFDHLSIP